MPATLGQGGRSACPRHPKRRGLGSTTFICTDKTGTLTRNEMAVVERDLEATVTLAFFVPGIVYMADAVGTQTEALIIRGLSVGVPIRRVVRNELITGAVVGLVLALAFLPLGWAIWGDADVAITVAIALFAACSTATVVAMALPWLLWRVGADPAFGSGPLATVLQDLLSLLIYFTVAALLVG